VSVADGGFTWQHLEFTELGRKRLKEVNAFLDRLTAAEHPLAERARDELAERLAYLDGYGGTLSDTDLRRRFRVTMGADMYPLSFTITWFCLDRATDAYAFSMRGGLVWHGGPGDPLSVCLDPEVLWVIHT
jgi:hypothetical protein